MAVLSLSRAQLAFGHVALLDQAEFSLEASERVGLIGRNGTGKSSLLKIIAGLAHLDDGLLVTQQNIRIAYVNQEPQFPPTLSVFDAVAIGAGESYRLLREYDALIERMNHHSDDALLDQMHTIQTHLDATHAWNLPNQIDSLLERLHLNKDMLMGQLSGGTQKRVALAQALIGTPDVLLLDEPTNHLDLSSIQWLEDLLKNYRGSILFITHDRRFLDNVATRIVELDRGQLRSFPGNFTAYKTRKAEQLEAEEIEQAKFDKFLAQEEIWIRKGVQARRTRDEGRVKRLEHLRLTRQARREQQGQVKLNLSAGERSGKIVAELDQVSKQYEQQPIVAEFTCTILRGDKVGLIGPNGSGKTTLLKLILGEIQPDQGTIRLGTKLQIAYFDQMRTQLNEEASLIDVISPGSEWVEINGQRKHVMTYLNDFLFAPERARSPVKTLSGGERNRLLLARLFAQPANVLVLDEPTNDLDIDTLELLEELLEDYSGTVFLVSHDRTFLDQVVTQVIVSEGKGHWHEYIGGYSDWERLQQTITTTEKEKKSTASTPKETTINNNKKLSYKEQQELNTLPNQITDLEQEQKMYSDQLLDPNLYQEPKKIHEIQNRLAKIEQLISEKMERWEELMQRSTVIK